MCDASDTLILSDPYGTFDPKLLGQNPYSSSPSYNSNSVGRTGKVLALILNRPMFDDLFHSVFVNNDAATTNTITKAATLKPGGGMLALFFF